MNQDKHKQENRKIENPKCLECRRRRTWSGLFYLIAHAVIRVLDRYLP